MRGVYRQKKRFNSKNGGFIVAELIVVLLIIALLAAILIPKVLGNIEVAKESAEIAETHTVTVTLQALLTMAYGNVITDSEDKPLTFSELTYFDINDRSNIKLTKRAYREMEALAGVKFGKVENVVLENNVSLMSFRYYTPNGSTVDYIKGQYFVIELH